MKTKINQIQSIFAIALFLFIGSVEIAQSKENVEYIIRDSEKAIKELIRVDSTLEKHFTSAYAYVIFPNVGKGAVGIGGAAGNGIVYEKGNMIGQANLRQISIGFQWGGQAYYEVIFFEDKEQLNNFKSNKVKLAAQVSAVAINEGVSANAEYENGIIILTMQKGGLMYEASVGGQKFKFKPFENN